MSDTDSSSPPSIASTSSSRFPLTYLRVLDGLPLPERYLIKDAAHPPVDDITISEISIPTQTVGDDDDTDLDASDIEDEVSEMIDDEVSDMNGTLKGSEEGSQESVYWKDRTPDPQSSSSSDRSQEDNRLDTGIRTRKNETRLDTCVRTKQDETRLTPRGQGGTRHEDTSRTFETDTDVRTRHVKDRNPQLDTEMTRYKDRLSKTGKESYLRTDRLDTSGAQTKDNPRQRSQSPELLTDGFKLQRKVRPRPPGRPAPRRTEDNSQGVQRKANIGYGAPRSESLPTAHVFPSPAFPASSAPSTSTTTTTSQHWNIRNTTTTNFEALQVDPDTTYTTSPPFVLDSAGAGYKGGGGVGSVGWDGTKGSHSQYTSDNLNYRALPPQQPSVLASTLPQASSSSIPGGSVYDSHLLHGSLSSQHHRSHQRSTSPSSYLPTGYTGWRGRGSSELGTAPLADDVTRWQQQHQEQLRRQQMEYTADPLRVGTLSTASSAGRDTVFDPHRLDSIRQAADNIIQEKDNIIDRQKLVILQLEQQGKASEAEMTRTMLKKTQGEVDQLRLKLQEQDYQNARLKARLTEVCTGGNETRSTLERKLGETEFSLQQLQLSKDQQMQDKDTQLLQLQTKIDELEKKITSWQDRYGSIQKTCSDLQQKNASLERYLQDIPTHDERKMKETKIVSLTVELERERGRVAELENQVADTRRSVTERDDLLRKLETCNREKEDIIDKLKEDHSSLTVEIQRLRGDGPPPEDDLEELKYKNTRLQADLDKARKLVETYERRHRESLRRRDAETREVCQRLEQEEANVHALREEVNSKDSDLKRVITSNKKLSRQKQELLEKTVALEEKVSSLSAAGGTSGRDEMKKMERRLLAELSVCFSELQSLVQICVQRADGHDPNLSALLGARASASASELASEPGTDDTLQALKYKCSKVRELRDELDRLREIISNKYAEDMGENLNCVTQ